MSEVKADDSSKVRGDEHGSDCDEPVPGPSSAAPFPNGKQDAGCSFAIKVPRGSMHLMDGTRLVSVIPTQPRPLDNFASCPFSPPPPLSPINYPFRTAPAAPFGGGCSKVIAEKLAEFQEAYSSNSFVVLRAANVTCDIVGEVKENLENQERDSAEDGAIRSSTPRKKKAAGGVSALTYALQMEAAKQAAEQEATADAEASGSDLKNDAGEGCSTAVEPLKNTHPRPEDLPWIPVRVLGPDGQPVIKGGGELPAGRSGRSDGAPAATGTLQGAAGPEAAVVEAPSRVEPPASPLEQDQTDEAPNRWQRFLMWCERLFCCRDYQPL